MKQQQRAHLSAVTCIWLVNMIKAGVNITFILDVYVVYRLCTKLTPIFPLTCFGLTVLALDLDHIVLYTEEPPVTYCKTMFKDLQLVLLYRTGSPTIYLAACYLNAFPSINMKMYVATGGRVGCLIPGPLVHIVEVSLYQCSCVLSIILLFTLVCYSSGTFQ